MTLVQVSSNVGNFLGGLGFTQSYETVRRGHVLRQGHATIRVFQLCTRAEAEASGSGGGGGGGGGLRPVDESVWLVELLVRGGQRLNELVADADAWLDLLLPFIQIHDPRSRPSASEPPAAISRVARR